jgi:hypothetical protein
MNGILRHISTTRTPSSSLSDQWSYPENEKSWIGTEVVTFFGYEVHPGKWHLSDTRKTAISAMVFPNITNFFPTS